MLVSRRAGHTVKLREAPKALSYQAASGNRAVARVMTSGTVITLEMLQWMIRSQVLSRGLPGTDAVHRLNGGGWTSSPRKI